MTDTDWTPPAEAVEAAARLWPTEKEWAPDRDCGGVAPVPGVPVWCEVHMMPFGHRRDGEPVKCSCGGHWATNAHHGKHAHDRQYEPPIVHQPVASDERTAS